MEVLKNNLSQENETISEQSFRMLRHKRSLNNQIFQIIKIKNKKKWTKEEDTRLIKLAEKFKEKHWKEISKNFTNKNALQCFSRYKRIRPGIIKGSWSREEDEKIMNLVKIYGKAWSKISKVLVSRNGKQIRDRFINVLDPDIKKGKFTEEEDRVLIRLYLFYGPKWATIAKHFNNRTADMIKNRFHSSIKKIFFSNGHRKNSFYEKKYNSLILESNYLDDNSTILCNATLSHTSNLTLPSLSYDSNNSNPICNQTFSFSIPDTKNSSPTNAENSNNNFKLNYDSNRKTSDSSSQNFNNITQCVTYNHMEENVEYREIKEYIQSLDKDEEILNYDEDLINIKDHDDFSLENGDNLFNFEDYFTV